jgi:hypothetical protein
MFWQFSGFFKNYQIQFPEDFMRPALVPFFKKRISTNPGRASKIYKKYMGSKCQFSNSS